MTMNLTRKNMMSLFDPKIGENLSIDTIKDLISSWVGIHNLPNGGRLKTSHLGISDISYLRTTDMRPAHIVSLHVVDQFISLSFDEGN
jgi:hypothetical protein